MILGHFNFLVTTSTDLFYAYLIQSCSFIVGFHFALADSFKVLTRSRYQIMRNIDKLNNSFLNDCLGSWFRLLLCVCGLVFLYGVMELVFLHYTSFYIINYLALNSWFSFSSAHIARFLSVAVIPNILIVCINLVNNVLSLVSSCLDYVQTIKIRWALPRSKLRQPSSVSPLLKILQLIFYFFSARLASMVSLGQLKTYQDHLGHAQIFGLPRNRFLSGSFRSRVLLFSASLSSSWKIVDFVIPTLARLCSACMCLLKAPFSYIRSSMLYFYQNGSLSISSNLRWKLWGYLTCLFRAYGRAITVSGNTSMLFSFVYNTLDKITFNPVSSMSFSISSRDRKSVAVQSKKPDVSQESRFAVGS